ncbi:MAG TPA: GspH/FimT family pseudopilin, partial [Longimicrobiaceae bacterium]|nr:GspH/FimT family pseudopilin [Longimicrobiaceae bacterium]
MHIARDNRGFTLLELLTVLVLLSIGASLAAPAFDRTVDRMRTRSALNRFAGDVYHARILAVRAGRPVVIRFPGAARCRAGGTHRFGTDQYVLVVTDTPEREVKRVALEGGQLCLEMNQSDSIRFDGRGLPRGAGNRSV